MTDESQSSDKNQEQNDANLCNNDGGIQDSTFAGHDIHQTNVQGNVGIDGGDFVGRDKISQGDQIAADKVSGDKTTVGDNNDIDALAIGPGALATSIKNFILNIPKFLAFSGLGVGGFLLIIIILMASDLRAVFRVVSATATPTDTPTIAPTLTTSPTPTPTVMPFAPASKNETLILIMNFHVAQEVAGSEIQTAIADSIQQKISTDTIPNLRVEVHPMSFGAITRDSAKEKATDLGKKFNASVVIWGSETRDRIEVYLLSFQESNLSATHRNLVDSSTNDTFSRSALYTYYATDRLTPQISFFSLFAIGQVLYIEEEYSHALAKIEEAVDSISIPVTSVEGLADTYFLLGWLYQVPEQGYGSQNAIAAYTTAITLDKNYTSAYSNRGNAYYAQGEYDLATADYTEVINRIPDEALAYNNRGNAHIMNGEYDLAIVDFTQAIERGSDDTLAYNNRGHAHIGNGELDLAIVDFTQAINLSPDNTLAYNNRGNAHIRNGELDLAIADYTKAIDLSPNNTLAYNNRGNAHVRNGEVKLAISDYDEAIRIDANNLPGYFLRGGAYFLHKEPELAIADFSKVIELYSNHGVYSYNEKFNFETQDLLELAVTTFVDGSDLAIIVTFSKNNDIRLDYDPLFLAYISRSFVHINQSEFDLALVDLRQAMNLAPSPYLKYFLQGTINLYFGDIRQGNYDSAINDFTNAINLDPDNYLGYFFRGLTYLLRRNRNLAIDDFNATVSLNPDLYLGYFLRGVTHFTQIDVDLALADFDKAIELNQNFYFAYFFRGFAYLFLKQPDLAVVDIVKAWELIEINNEDSLPKQIMRDLIDHNDILILLRGIPHLHQGNYDLAIDDFTQAINLNPENYLGYLLRSIAYARKDELSLAGLDFFMAGYLGGDDMAQMFSEVQNFFEK